MEEQERENLSYEPHSLNEDNGGGMGQKQSED